MHIYTKIYNNDKETMHAIFTVQVYLTVTNKQTNKQTNKTDEDSGSRSEIIQTSSVLRDTHQIHKQYYK